MNPKPARVVQPGRIIKRELDARGWTQNDLAAIMGRPKQAISEIVSGKKQIMPETARELAQAFGTSAALWLNLEMNYQLHLAEREEMEETIAHRSRLYSLVPIGELVKRSWICASDSPDGLEREVCSFLGIRSLDVFPSLAVSFRHSARREPALGAEIAWVKRVEQLAEAQEAAPFDLEVLRRNIPTILALSEREEDVAKVPDALLRLGVRSLVVPHLLGTYIDGAALYVSEQPVVAITLRYDRIDAFWFTLMHELAHIIMGHRHTHLDQLYGKEAGAEDLDKDELTANQRAQDWLIDSEALYKFIQAVQPRFARSRIVEFARSQGRHPGIVLGRLQHEGVVEYSHLRPLLTKVSPYLAEWVDVAKAGERAA